MRLQEKREATEARSQQQPSNSLTVQLNRIPATKTEGFDSATRPISRPCHCHDHLAFHLGCSVVDARLLNTKDTFFSKTPMMSQPEYPQALHESFHSSNVRLWASFTTLRHCYLNVTLATCSTWVVGMGNKQLIDYNIQIDGHDLD